MILRLLPLLLSAALAADPLTWGEPLEATVEKEQWQDFYVDVADDDANLYFEVVANSASASALGLYVSEGGLRPPAERLSPGAFLDYDETSMIASGSREEPKRAWRPAWKSTEEPRDDRRRKAEGPDIHRKEDTLTFVEDSFAKLVV